jgi:hypothetical protein
MLNNLLGGRWLKHGGETDPGLGAFRLPEPSHGTLAR